MQRGTVLGFYQEAATAQGVLKRLRAGRVYRAALLYKRKDGRVTVQHGIPPRVWAGVAGIHVLLALAVLAGLITGRVNAPACILSVLWFALVAVAWRRYSPIPAADLSVFKSQMVREESLVVAFVRGTETGPILDILRQNAGENPTTFAFYPPARVSIDDNIEAMSPEPLSPDRLAQQARDLAASHVLTRSSQHGRPLHARLQASARVIARVRQHLAAVARVEPNILLSAEWLLDNGYVIQGQIEDFRRSLPRRYEQELPILAGSEKIKTKKSKPSLADKVKPDTGPIGETNAAAYDEPELTDSETTPEPDLPLVLQWLATLKAWEQRNMRFHALSRRRQVLTQPSALLFNTEVPRVYDLARVLIDGTDARIDRDNIHNFLQAYQSVTPLTIGELWAVPLMLRLRLIELLRVLAVTVDQRQTEREIADFWANRLLTSARRDPDQLHAFTAELVREVPFPTPHFAEQLVGHLYDEETALAPVREWLERRLEMSLVEASAFERTNQTREQVSLGSAIASLRGLGRLDYPELFESVSRVDAVLFSDHAGVYPNMDFATRDRYRHAIEEVARRSKDTEATEISVALKVVEMADAAPDVQDVSAHIGYYLIDKGLPILEAQANSNPRPRILFQRWTERHGTGLYVGAIGGLTAGTVTILCLQAVRAGTSPFLLVPCALLALFPASEVAVQVVNWFVTRILPPRSLPKMDFEQGIPSPFRTLVVVPMMLLTPESIQEEIDRLEIRYLANPDGNLRYALLSDFSDALQPHAPEDAERLDVAIRGIERLNDKYPDARFLLFHRDRAWSETESRWMGWERKRGKLEQMNALLMSLNEGIGEENGLEDASASPASASGFALPAMMVRAGDVEDLRGIRFVITLDADTQLPRDTGRRLVETLAHPLNQPVVRDLMSGGPETSARVERGYTILQPRVSTSLPSATASYFSRLFTDPRGTDPYTRAVSDVYQDLTNEGSYHGKGIYDLAAFHKVLGHRFPTSTLLSHDLIEGAHVRVGLATDVELFDLFPRDYVVYSGRNHRWVRGDWQISDWIGRRVPGADGAKVANPLSVLNRWKIFDNLRRSTLPIASILLCVLAWLLGTASTPAQWTWLVLWTFLTPPALQLLGSVTRKWQRDPLMWVELATSLVRATLFLSLLPHQAALNLDATVRVLFRKLVSHRLMLEWQTASEAGRRSRDKRKTFARNLGLISLAALVVGLTLALVNPGALLVAAPFLTLWAASPVFVALLNREVKRDTASRLTSSDKRFVRQVARQTWRFFDDLSGPQTNHLPPDNYQIDLRVEVAPRTSPTNMGLDLLANLAAQDMGYITLDEVVERVHASLTTIDGLEKYEGHVFNWYDIYTKQALPPRYVSFVDSGNLLGDLWALNEGILERLDAPLLDSVGLRGLNDSLALLHQSLDDGIKHTLAAMSQGGTRLLVDARLSETITTPLTELEALCKHVPDAGIPGALEALIRAWRAARQPARRLAEAVAAQQETQEEKRTRGEEEKGASSEPQTAQSIGAQSIGVEMDAKQGEAAKRANTIKNAIYWSGKIQAQVEAWNVLIDRYFGWVELLGNAPTDVLLSIGQDAHEWSRQAVASLPSLRTLGSDHVAGLAALSSASERLDRDTMSGAARDWLDKMAHAHSQAQWFAGEKLAQAEESLALSHKLADGMNLHFLYDAERRAFSIGYNVEERRLDNFYYDLLASEARLGSFVAVARGDVPVEHWFALGRPFASAYGQRALLSWSGTMFEYLMPLLLTRHYENSLLDQGCRAAVSCQIAYGKRRSIPWGISEAAYSALDTRQIYQYRAFGVPGLGLKRGLENDMVVAPYATALSLPLMPAQAVQNLKTLARRGVRGDMGFFESIDYTRQSDAQGDRGVIVSTYMAHHQGMSLLAIDNLLNDNIMQDRFHADPRVQATESLLYERVPNNPPLARDYAAQIARTKTAVVPQTGTPVRINTPDGPTPRTHLLANTDYSVMITNSGSGVSRWKDLEINRWRADTTRDNSGTYLYIKDLEDGSLWSATGQPLGGAPRNYSAVFTPEKAEFTRRDNDIETRTEVVVSPEDNVEVRRMMFINHSGRSRRLELTSYIELALASHAADRAHPAFSKLFVQTEALPEHDALLASRRARKSGDPTPWAVHIVSVPEENLAGQSGKTRYNEYETDRAKFLGRNGTAARPQGLDGELTGSVGAVLDPIFSLRRRIVIAPGARVEVKFVTGAAEDRETAVALAEKYCQLGAANRAVEMAWTYAQLDLRHLRIQPDEAMRYQQLASYVIYPSAGLRATEERLKRNRLAQPGLWAHGISGDLPIVVMTIGDVDDIEAARQIIVAHNYWRSRGLKCDLVILNEESASYEQPLQDQLRRIIGANAQMTGQDQPGGVFLRPSRDIPEDDLTLILTVARVVLVAARGGIAQQLGGLAAPRALPPVRGQSQAVAFTEEPSAPLPFMELPYFNGTGGFTTDGKEYVIYLGPNAQTPAPWINVMANPLFGTLVSESGMGYTWYGNSQTNRLTPWSNDPVLDPFGEAIYIRDEDLGVVWTPTPRPIREQDAYRVHHGQGYSRWEHNSHAIEQELLTFVPVDDNGGAPVRVQRLRLHNASSHKRRLTITGVVDWTLGVEREDTQMHVVTEWDKNAQALLARNAYHPDFGGRVAFMTSLPAAASYTGDRTEFLGRNGSARTPAGLRRIRLSNRAGAGMDPCGALQVPIELEPNQTVDVLFLLGQGADANDARNLAYRFRDPANVEQALQTTIQWWERTLNVITVDTPELSVNFLLNRWLLYQDISCRVWGRSAFYQSGGAFGFRDQLQDIMALLYSHPAFAREQILRSSSRQFVEGDVQHWWLPPSGAGVRTRISDDLLWLPYVVAQYVRVTGDGTILDEVTPFLDGKPLEPDEHEVFNTPTVSQETATLLEHCRRALHKGDTSGPHGLPLIGAGDWNDGLNRVGAEGKGESVWLAWFLVHVLNDFAYLLREGERKKEKGESAAALSAASGTNGANGNAHANPNPASEAKAVADAKTVTNGAKAASKGANSKGIQAEQQAEQPTPSNGQQTANNKQQTTLPETTLSEADQCERQARDLAQTIETQAWDGAWYRRAYFDDGTPLGSAQSEEAKIDSLPQSWSVICGLGDAERSTQALQSVERYLVKEKGKLPTANTGTASIEETNNKQQTTSSYNAVLLFTPAFDKTPHDPGYIKGYVPGVRENGGQYTHGSLWMPLAYAMRGEGDHACRLLRLMNPAEHTRTPEDVLHYKVEPYVAVADIYSLQGQEGRGGWSWYTGSAGWMYRVWVENALGLQKRGDTLSVNPSIPAEWNGFTLRYRHGNAMYEISIENPQHVQHGVGRVELDGALLADKIIALSDDGQTHRVRILLGTGEEQPTPAPPPHPEPAQEEAERERNADAPPVPIPVPDVENAPAAPTPAAMPSGNGQVETSIPDATPEPITAEDTPAVNGSEPGEAAADTPTAQPLSPEPDTVEAKTP